MTHGEIIRTIERNALLNHGQAQGVVDYYWDCGVLRREQGEIKIADEIYFSRPMILIALGDALVEEVRK